MKLFKLIVIVLCTGFLNVGCTSTESPEQLIKKPIHNEQEANLYKSINATLGKGSSILLPKNSSEVATINTVDLDNNGSDEIVVFQKQENFNEVNNKVGFSVLLNDGKNIIDSHLIDGDSIEYANFFDLDNDGYKEIILLSKKDNKTTMEVYKFKENKIIRLTKFDPSWIDNKDDFTEMKVKIKNLDNDGKLDIIIANFNPKTHVMTVSLAYFDQYVKLRDFSVFNDVKNLDSAYLDIKKVSKDKKGIIVDTKSFTENDSYITQILYLENDNLKKAFDEKNIKVTKPYYIPVEDINNDGIAEIPMINGNSRGYNQKSSLNISWNIWNGKTKESSNLVFVSQIYYNYQNNFRLSLPNNLANKIYIDENFSEGKSEFMYYDIHQSEPIKLFTITKISKNKIDESKNQNTSNGGTILKENDSEMYVLVENSPKVLKDLNISKDAIKENFSLIY